MDKVRVGVIGATGYTGIELLKLLIKHPQAKITYISSESQNGNTLYKYNPYFRDRLEEDLIFSSFNVEKIKSSCNLIFFTTPKGVAMKQAPKLYNSKVKIIDLSGDFRLKTNEDYLEWYGMEHTSSESLSKWTYGLSEIFREKIEGCKYISNPGCYPTSILLGLIPLLYDFEPHGTIICDSKSGVSGKGKRLSEDSLYFECNENVIGYKLSNHQHTPEIELGIKRATSKDIKVSFTPHLIPMDRGILSTMYISLSKNRFKIDEMLEHYKRFYEESQFVKVLETCQGPIQTKRVSNTNECHISLNLDERTNTLKIVSVLDNLIKGAVGSALQNFNIMNGLKESTGLI